MAITLICPKCDARLTVPDTAAGKKGRCPSCATLIPVAVPPPLVTEFLPDEPNKAGPPPLPTGPQGKPSEPPVLEALPAAPKGRFSRRTKVLAGCAAALLLVFVVAAIGSGGRSKPAVNPLVKSKDGPGTTYPTASTSTTSTKSTPSTYTPPPRTKTYTPTYTPTPVYTPPAPVVDNTARRNYLRQEIARLQAAINTDRELVSRQQVAAPAFRIGGKILANLLNNSKNANDQRAAPIVSPVLSGGGDALGSEVERARAAAEARISSNQALLNQYQTELNRLGW